MNNSRSNVYRGAFRKSAKACEFTHVGVFMRTRLADSHFAVFLLTGTAGHFRSAQGAADYIISAHYKVLSKNRGSWERVGLVSFRVVLEWAILGWVKTHPDLFGVRLG
jgi:hypothetical protein